MGYIVVGAFVLFLAVCICGCIDGVREIIQEKRSKHMSIEVGDTVRRKHTGYTFPSGLTGDNTGIATEVSGNWCVVDNGWTHTIDALIVVKKKGEGVGVEIAVGDRVKT